MERSHYIYVQHVTWCIYKYILMQSQFVEVVGIVLTKHFCRLCRTLHRTAAVTELLPLSCNHIQTNLGNTLV